MNQERRVLAIGLQVAFIVCCLAMISLRLFFKKDAHHAQIEGTRNEITNWNLVGTDGSRKGFTTPVKLDVPEGETVLIEAFLPDDIEENMQLSIFCNRDMKIFIGGELRKEFDSQIDLPGGLVKSVCVFCDINMQDRGKLVDIELSSPHYNGEISEIYYGDSLGLIGTYLRENGLYYISSLFLIAFSLATIVIASIMQRFFKHRLAIVELATSGLFAGLWVSFSSPCFQFVFDVNYIDGPACYMAGLLLPYPVLRYVNDMQKGRMSWINELLQTISLVEFAVFSILHFTGQVSFNVSAKLIDILTTLMIITILCIIFYDMFRGHINEYRLGAIGLLGLGFFAFCEIIALKCLDVMQENRFLLIGIYFMFAMGIAQQMKEIIEGERARRQAEVANAHKSTFLANMSHEIRTPINSVIGMNELILREAKEPEIREYAAQAQTSGKLLLGLINDVLDFSKIEAGKMSIINSSYKIVPMINDIERMLIERASQKNLETVNKVSESLPSSLIGDEKHIKQIMTNLISNAVKYTNSGTITFSIESVRSVRDNFIDLKITVQDTGIGIKEDSLEKLFDTFTRVDEKRNSSIEGTGLGLSIVKHLTEQMGGTVNVESRYGAGSKFTVVIPQEVYDPIPIGKIEDAFDKKHLVEEYRKTFTAPEAQVLIVDDNAVNLKVAKKLLTPTGMQIDTASGGKECIYMCRNKRYDIILMDHRMPDPDGVETMHLLKEDFEGLNNTTKIIVLTANALAGMREEYIAEGFTDYIAKPIEPKVMEATILKYLPARLIARNNQHNSDMANNNGLNTNVADERKGEGMEYSRMTLKERLGLIAGLDVEKFYEQYGDTDDFIPELLDTIISDGREKITMMYKYLEDANYKDFGIEAHAVKSVMATVFASELSAHAKEHEFAAKEGRISYCREDGPAFLKEYSAMLNELEKALKG